MLKCTYSLRELTISLEILNSIPGDSGLLEAIAACIIVKHNYVNSVLLDFSIRGFKKLLHCGTDKARKVKRSLIQYNLVRNTDNNHWVFTPIGIKLCNLVSEKKSKDRYYTTIYSYGKALTLDKNITKNYDNNKEYKVRLIDVEQMIKSLIVEFEIHRHSKMEDASSKIIQAGASHKQVKKAYKNMKSMLKSETVMIDTDTHKHGISRQTIASHANLSVYDVDKAINLLKKSNRVVVTRLTDPHRVVDSWTDEEQHAVKKYLKCDNMDDIVEVFRCACSGGYTLDDMIERAKQKLGFNDAKFGMANKNQLDSKGEIVGMVTNFYQYCANQYRVIGGNIKYKAKGRFDS